MSAGPVPEGLKVITPYLQRASQLADKEPVVSYYSNYYAAKLAIQKANKDNRTFIDSLLTTLEKQRQEIGENEAISNDLVGYAHIENFALKIFTRADDEDRQGQASQKTAKNYVAAANFLELLKVFGDIDSDIEEKIKYSKWRAAEIVKAIRDGRTPAPPQGAPSSNDQDLLPSNPAGAGASSANGTMGGVTSPTLSTQSDSAPGTSATSFSVPANGFASGGDATAASHPTIANFPSPPLSNATPPIHHQQFQQPTSQPPPPPPAQHPQFHDNAFQQQHHQTTISGSPIVPSLAPAPPALPASTPHVPPSPFAPNQPPMQQPQFQHQHQHQQQHQQQPTLPMQPYIQSSPLPPHAPPQQPPSAPSQPMNQYQHSVPSHPYQQHQQSSPAFSPAAPVPMVLDPAVSAQVQKHCKWTISALTYDDVPTAIDNLEKALFLLKSQDHA